MIETRSAWWCAAAILVGGCATTPLPEGIGAAPPGNPDYERVRVDTGAHAGEAVRWGGAVAGVEN
ncbi:MAG: hypothetical protein GWN85_38775, partial [Gemmatimonadetes bacterium]|nr:hypothetical protein [Gemmatimonadota bacterium]